ncbi:hypothetical protein Lade_1215 [Legionella adelaidensis]|uniref:Uncharacterized protein n=1 Tax=Legionella adelaidensis TaxID=45056 RepID=A0A0W0R6A7_9GAMM|nr:hypothetical protein [Legionella adelaidensis]KTC66557.1 hypothetical protein Lade_1215 [Legionella adelaidensis]
MNNKLEKIADPLKFYLHPSEVENEKELTLQEKIKLLNNWLDDIKLRQIAEEENMPPNKQTRYYTAEVEYLLQKYKKESESED